MFKLRTSRNLFATYSLLCIGVLAVDGESPGTANDFSVESSSNTYFVGTDKSPLNRHTKQFVKNYIQKNQASLRKIQQRSSSPFNMIDSVLGHYGLPLQLKYLAVVESDLKAHAVSRVGAAGPWQLMPETAHIMGLKITRHCDERNNYYKSTRAAALHLKDLHAEYGDWLLAFAAYNAGEVPVNAAIRETGSRNFWVMQRNLPLETRIYVKKFIATCYYFEGAGSLANLSSGKAMTQKKKSESPAPIPHTELQPLNIVAKKENEPREEKFKRIMKESAASLARSNQQLGISK
jgi:membrane-bound lytic murein transglycosylase D